MDTTRAKVPHDALILVEVGSQRPEEVSFNPFGPFEMLWVVTNGRERRQLLWVRAIRTGIYVAHGIGPGTFHTSYHVDGAFHRKVEIPGQPEYVEPSPNRPPLADIQKPEQIQSATIAIHDEALARFDLTDFTDKPVDRLIYLDNRIAEAINYQVWVVPPFKHGEVPLITEWPANIHVVTHTIPWIEVVIYEQGRRRDLPRP